jgi:NAD-dependent dihydropyrimidine dehydrogenase PreA subunit
MIIYFSATGNSLYTARRLSDQGEQILSMTDLLRQKQFELSDEKVGIVSPTYDWGLPSLVREYLSRVQIQADYVYFVATYGMVAGGIWHEAEKALSRKPDAYFSVRMPDTWTVIFDLSTEEKVAKFTRTTERDLQEVKDAIQSKKQGNMMRRKASGILSDLMQSSYEKQRKTSHFTVKDSCIGCGKCERSCPAGAIRIENGKPVWIKQQCVMCLGCLHRCPTFSIQYEKSTEKHGQYLNPHVSV